MPSTGTPGVVDGGVERAGRPSTWTDLGPPERMIPAGRAGRQLGGGDGVGDDLAVDVGLAHPPGDQLGVLGAEVDDEDGVELLGRSHGDR